MRLLLTATTRPATSGSVLMQGRPLLQQQPLHTAALMMHQRQALVAGHLTARVGPRPDPLRYKHELVFTLLYI